MPEYSEALLFSTGVTSVQVRCWSCGHMVKLTQDKLPSGITRHDFERKAKCRCGKGWPQVKQLPKLLSRW